MDVEEKIRELSQRVEKLEQENKKLKKRNRQLQSRENEDTEESSKISRRKFLKMLGVGAGGLALSSSAAGLTWSKITPRSQGTSDINAEIASGLKSSVVGDGLKNGQSSALSVEPADFAGSYLQDDGNDNLAVDTSSIATRSWVNSNADVPNADYADNADQLDGNDASAFVTTTDLSNHSSNGSAHHTRPDSTQTTSSSSTWTTVGTYFTTDYGIDTVDVGGLFIDGVEVNGPATLSEITYVNGKTVSHPYNFSGTSIPAGYVDSVTVSNDTDQTNVEDTVNVNEPGLPPHSHSI